ncbi:MAG: Asp-tRNA(Asn)/Glu-tRNA(Gln) amidotransferase subunit GatA [Candidatus Omnitrophica bacterium]|nr:Asp-tRNA(Asn)/Glu-tRNA(Gln) amidotransferase subunit GatA [Candidatus Omnitrophota bacterium]
MKDIFKSIEAYRLWEKEEPRSPEDKASFIADRIDVSDRDLNAFITLDREAFSRKAKAAFSPERRKSPLGGVPVAVKSNICVEGELTTCASRMLEGFRPPYNATVIEKLDHEGAFVISGANMDEFAFGSSCETSAYGPSRNPWDEDRIPGGSSGGSAVAVSSGQVVCALGSDTGGSIRQPASLCGVVGFKPTYGRVSRYGLIAFASSLDQIGPLARNVTDCATLLKAISGYDEKDSTSVNIEVPDYCASLGMDIKGMKVGMPSEYFQEGIDGDVQERLREAVKALEELGAEILEVSLPHTRYAVSCYYIIGPAEASSNLGRYDGVHYGYRDEEARDMIDMYVRSRTEGFGDEAKRRIILGTYALSSGYYEAYYLKALKVRTCIAEDFRKAFEVCDAIVTPTSPTTAFRIGEKSNDPLKMYLSDIFTIPANLAGIPAVSIPCGLGDNGMPVGMQLMAAPFAEEKLIRIAHAFERNTGFHELKPGTIED